jgi:hypothetical protein
MFGFLKPNPIKKLKKQYAEKLEQGMNAQRNGDMRLYASLTAEADSLYKEIQRLEAAES